MCWKFTWNWLRLNPGHEMRVSSVQYNIYYYYMYMCVCARIYNLIESFNFSFPLVIEGCVQLNLKLFSRLLNLYSLIIKHFERLAHDNI